MNIPQLYGLSALLSLVAGVSGCTDGGATAFRHENQNDFPGLIAESTAIQQSAIKDTATIPSSTTLVSAASAKGRVQPSLITLVTDGDLNAKIRDAGGPVLLDFFADWCGPCRIQGKILHDVEGIATKTHTLIIKINVDEHPQIAEQLQVQSLPTLMMIKNGKIVARQSGVANKNRLAAWMR